MAKIYIEGDPDLVRTAMVLPVDIPVGQWPTPITFTAAPSISSADNAPGTPIFAIDGTLSVAGVQYHQWMVDGVAIPGQTGGDYTPTAADNGKVITRRSGVVNWNVTVVSNPITVSDVAAADWPANIAANLFEVTERRNPSDPLAGAGGRRTMVIGAVVVPTGFTLLRYMGTGAVTGAGNPAVANTTYELTTEYATGTDLRATLLWKRISDGATKVALPPTGTTAGAATDGDTPPKSYPRALTPIPGNTGQGELLVEIEGLYGSGPTAADFAPLSSPALTEALAAPLTRWYNNNPGSSNNADAMGNTALALAYASMMGQTSAYTQTLAQARRLLDLDGNGGGVYPAAIPAPCRLVSMVTFFQIIKQRCPQLQVGGAGAVTGALTALEMTKMDRAVEALAIAAASISSGNKTKAAAGHPQGSGEDLNLTGFAIEVSQGANFDIGPPFLLIACACYMGAQACANFLDTLNMATFRSALLAAGWDTGSKLYATMNHRNTGVSAATAATMTRYQASIWAPTDAAIQAACKNYTYRGVPLTDFGGMLYFTRKPVADANGAYDRNGWFSAFPLGPDHGNRPEMIGRIMGGIEASAANGWKGTGLVSASGNLAGIMLGSDADRAAIPYLGQRGMVYEWAGRDATGQRWSPNYTNWTWRACFAVLLSMELVNAIPHGMPLWDDELAVVHKFREVRAYMMAKGVRGWAHHGTQAGGAGGPELYDAVKWRDACNEGLWDATLPRMIPT